MLPKFRLHEKLSESDIASMDMEKYLYYVIDPKFVIRIAYKNLQESFNNDIPDDFMRKFKLNPYADCILENLNTHDSNMLIKKIKDTFSMDVRDISDIKGREKRYLKLDLCSNGHFNNEIENIIDSETFKHLVEFFGYSISYIAGTLVVLEPVYADDANNIVYGEEPGCAYGRLYHITTKKNADKILMSGFRISDPKQGRKEDGTNRYYPKRIYFLALPPKKEKIQDREEIKNAIEFYFSEKQKEDGYCVLQADVRGLGIDFYMDSASEGDYRFFDMENCAVYTYCNIPKERVRLVYTSV